MARNDGGSAFPAEYYSPETFMELRATEGVITAKRLATGVSQGMSLRDWFAGQAIPAAEKSVQQTVGKFDEQSIAQKTYAIADAMLAEREKGNG